MEPAERYQRQLLEQARRIFHDTPISHATENAYLATPRHLFVPRYREWATKEWQEVTADNLGEHLAILYADRPLILFGDDDENLPSTISQPSFVLHMLDMLRLEPGHKVFELGAGSGWNAALMGHLVGPEGHVYSLEIIPEVARRAAGTMAALGRNNVTVIEADGGDGYAPGVPYDRAIFTAGAYDLPRHIYQQIENDGLLLVVIKSEGGGDNLFILRKTDDHFESVEAAQCGFVQMAGKYHVASLDPIYLEELPAWADLERKEISRTPFWWRGKGKASFMWRTLGVRSFLGVTEPLFRAFKTTKTKERPHEEHYFGLWDDQDGSLVIARDDCLISYGHAGAKERLLHDIERWVDLGMPTTTSFDLRVYPIGAPLTVGRNQWLVKRNESQFLWEIRG